MRTTSTAVRAVLACLLTGAALAGCSDGTTSASEELSAEEMLDDANDTMGALRSVTVDATTTSSSSGAISSRFTTDLKSRCTSKVTWTATGASLEQIRIGETDYVRPNRAYLNEWSSRSVTTGQNTWIKTPASKAQPGDGLSACTREFTSFGTATKGRPTKVDGTPALPLVVTDKEDKGGTYTFYVATEGEPYILKVVYKGAKYRTTTGYSAFDEPLDVQPPARTEVLDESDLGL